MTPETDEAIYARYLGKGNSEDLRVLLERYRESFTLFLFGYVHNMEDAEELMMDAFAIAAAGKSGFARRSSFKTWLFGIGRNLARKQYGRGKSVQAGETLRAAEQPDLEILKNERRQELYVALETLPDDYRQAIYLLYYEDMTIEEIARVMGKSKKQIYNLAFRGKQALREVLERNGFENAQY